MSGTMRPACLTTLLLSMLLAVGCAADARSEPAAGLDLGDFPAMGKADTALVVEVPFEVPAGDGEAPGQGAPMMLSTCGELAITTNQDRAASWERLQLDVQSSIYRRRSWRGRSPYVTVPAERTGGDCVQYTLTMLNWGTAPAFGTLTVATEPPVEPGVEVVFNQPDCDGCEDPSGQLRRRVVTAIQSARQSIDLAIYGIDDPAVVEALCNAAEAGVDVRVVTEDASEAPSDGGYYRFLFGPDGLAGCGAQVEAVRSSGLMHHKFLLIDADEWDPLLVTGSTNLTVGGLERNHNHMLFVRGAPELVAAYRGEHEQLLRHCASRRLDGRSCAECTPGCTEDRSVEGPWLVGDTQVSSHFSISDDPLRVLRGEVETLRRDTPDPACEGDDADCICRQSGSRYSCDYCAMGEDGWGLLGAAERRISMTMFSATDQCFAVGLVRAAARGVEVVTVWDFVKGGSMYSRDDYVCASGVETWVTNWGGGSAQVRNHNKTVVVDDVVFDGSLNLSASGARKNNENTLVLESATLADEFAAYIEAETELLAAGGVTPRSPEDCRCRDLVDNDHDGLFDVDDPDCDSGE